MILSVFSVQITVIRIVMVGLRNKKNLGRNPRRYFRMAYSEIKISTFKLHFYTTIKNSNYNFDFELQFHMTTYFGIPYVANILHQ